MLFEHLKTYISWRIFPIKAHRNILFFFMVIDNLFHCMEQSQFNYLLLFNYSLWIHSFFKGSITVLWIHRKFRFLNPSALPLKAAPLSPPCLTHSQCVAFQYLFILDFLVAVLEVYVGLNVCISEGTCFIFFSAVDLGLEPGLYTRNLAGYLYLLPGILRCG